MGTFMLSLPTLLSTVNIGLAFNHHTKQEWPCPCRICFVSLGGSSSNTKADDAVPPVIYEITGYGQHPTL
jgi:hypothetical protein